MKAKSNEALCFTVTLILLGLLSLYGGAHWLGYLIPSALLVWLDDRVENRN
jgi:hypothetical protein